MKKNPKCPRHSALSGGNKKGAPVRDLLLLRESVPRPDVFTHNFILFDRGWFKAAVHESCIDAAGETA